MQFHSLNICVLKENKSLESIFAEDFTEMGVPSQAEFSPDDFQWRMK